MNHNPNCPVHKEAAAEGKMFYAQRPECTCFEVKTPTLQQIKQSASEKFDEKKFKWYDTYNNDFICINDHPLSDEIKSFLESELDLAYTAGIEAVEKELPEEKNPLTYIKESEEWFDETKIIGFNSCLSIIKDKISKLKK